MTVHVRVSGDALTRGRMYGEQAAAHIRRSIDGYAATFAHYAGWDWPTAVAHATKFVEPIEAFDPKYLDEMRGIAEGAGVAFEDVLAINLRTEIMFAGKVRAAEATLPRGECTSLAVLPRDPGDRTLVAQNWDWLLPASDTVVVVEAEQDDGPAYVTAVEAGLLAKVGMNSHGLALATNALVSARDRGEPGVPYHVLLRAVLDAPSVTHALQTLQRSPRSSSANYVIADESGVGLIIEAEPGDFSRLRLTQPGRDGLLVHGNHFEHPRFDSVDVGLSLMADSPVRVQRARAWLAAEAAPLSPERLLAMFSDHVGHPMSICCHPAPGDHPREQSATIVSVVMDPAARTMWHVPGTPCTTPAERIDYSELLAPRSPVPA